MSVNNKKIDFIEKPHGLSSIKKVIGIVSGKGGVGKISCDIYDGCNHEQKRS